jgi:hypothetical protein
MPIMTVLFSRKQSLLGLFLSFLFIEGGSAHSPTLSIGGIYAADIDSVDRSYESALKGAIRGVTVGGSVPLGHSLWSFLAKGTFDVNRSTLKTSHPELGDVKIRTKSLYSLGAGLGYSVTPSVMPYVMGGIRKIKKTTTLSQTVYSEKLRFRESVTDEEMARYPDGYASYEQVGKTVNRLTRLRHVYPFAEIGVSYKLHERVSTSFSIRHTFFGSERTPFRKKSNPHTTAFVSLLYHFF